MLLINREQDGGTERMLVNGSRGVVSRVRPIGAIIAEREHQLKLVPRDAAPKDEYDEGARALPPSSLPPPFPGLSL